MEDIKRYIFLVIVVVLLLGVGSYLIFKNSNNNKGEEQFKALQDSLCSTTLSLVDDYPNVIIIDKTKPGTSEYVTIQTLSGLTIGLDNKVSRYIEDPRKSTAKNPVYFPDTTRIKLSVTNDNKIKCDGIVDVGNSPVIKLVGGDKINVTKGSKFVDPGYTALDAEDGDLTSKVLKNGIVDTNTLGDYTLLYFVQDKMGNITYKTRIVTVK